MARIAHLASAVALCLTTACSLDAPMSPPVQPNQVTPPVSLANGPKSSEQVVFSGVAGINSTFGSPVGFWVWCEAESNNPYDEECNGALYFYALGITRHVEGEVSEDPPGVYTMDVSSTLDDAIKHCRLVNGLPIFHGPNNTVTVTCDTPGGSATSTTAVVNVTGPS